METKYRSLAKERPWAEHLTSLLFPHLPMKEHPGHVYGNSIPEALKNNNVHRSHEHDVTMSMMSP